MPKTSFRKNSDSPISEHIHQHCNESMERALLAERHPLWARSCPELKDIDFIRLGLLRCIVSVNSLHLDKLPQLL
ncbi:hypothetical protein [Bathymodiolus japonicus methanotrophic gill symbiont]|uniref:hypothetical protein n=1 Tax=Bathymodiolus japonicus methanotrophic gill symbiont TaxID=113269 RepID=UPI001C8EBE74|nr:hypothetical protein [Bathymodiolus japonicus methanotrophic gill symbiont]